MKIGHANLENINLHASEADITRLEDNLAEILLKVVFIKLHDSDLTRNKVKWNYFWRSILTLRDGNVSLV